MITLSELEETKKLITKTQNRLYYILNKDKVNAKRKTYKRQKWSERADNPKNKKGVKDV